jgi:DNA-binding transcriptional ArsR family regulator
MALPVMDSERPQEQVAAMMQQARAASDLLKALSHEARLVILCILSEGEKSVSELEQILMLPQAAVSQHLARLRYDRLVTSRRDGRMIYYTIASPEVSRVVETLYDLFCRQVRSPGAE